MLHLRVVQPGGAVAASCRVFAPHHRAVLRRLPILTVPTLGPRPEAGKRGHEADRPLPAVCLWDERREAQQHL
eukprot:6114021-Pyramimonas_sp.AAC.1